MKRLIPFVFLASIGALVVPAFAAPGAVSPVVSRAEAVKVLVEQTPVMNQRLQVFRHHMPALPLFDDVPNANALAPYLEAAFEQGVIVGNEQRIFRPTEPVTEEELVVLHARMIAMTDPEAASGLSKFQPGDEWYQPALRILYAHGIATPKPFSPGSPARRSSVAYMTQQVVAYTSSKAPVIVASSQESVAISSEASNGTISAVPQFLPIKKLQSLNTDNGTQINAGAANAVTTTAEIVANSPSLITQTQAANISAGNNDTGINAGGGQAAEINAGSGNAGTVSQNSQNSGGQAVVIDAGGGDINAGTSTTFTITIPRLNIGPLTVTNPEDPFTHNGLLAPLKNGVGHLFSTPGGGGKILVYGHSSSYPWDVSSYTKIFRRINELNPGDEILVDYNGQQYKYVVSYEETVPAKDMSAYQDDGNGEDLILYTCWPPDSIQQRYLVHAKPV